MLEIMYLWKFRQKTAPQHHPNARSHCLSSSADHSGSTKIIPEDCSSRRSKIGSPHSKEFFNILILQHAEYTTQKEQCWTTKENYGGYQSDVVTCFSVTQALCQRTLLR